MPSTRILPEINFETVDNLTKRLCLEAQIVVNLSFFGDKAWMRLSANVYNSQEDYVKLRDRLAQFFQIPIHCSNHWYNTAPACCYFCLFVEFGPKNEWMNLTLMKRLCLCRYIFHAEIILELFGIFITFQILSRITVNAPIERHQYWWIISPWKRC